MTALGREAGRLPSGGEVLVPRCRSGLSRRLCVGRGEGGVRDFEGCLKSVLAIVVDR